MAEKLPPPLGPLRYPLGLTEDDFRQRNPAVAAGRAPKVTVLTPSFNQAEFLETTLRSVLVQDYPNLEYLVVDGGSTDGSLDILRHYAPHLSRWVSEKDRGQADAIAKGLGWATGEWFNWINSDDVLAPGALWTLAQTAPDADALIGATTEFLDDRVIRQVTNEHLSIPGLLRKDNWHQPSIWLRREPMARLGLDLRYHYRFDYLLLLRYLAHHPRFQRIPETLAYFRLHGASKTMSFRTRFRAEKRAALLEIAADPLFAEWKQEVELLVRKLEWRDLLEKIGGKRSQSRWTRALEVIRSVDADRGARCTATTRRAIVRLILRGGRRRRKPGRPE